MHRKALGKGLEALIPTGITDTMEPTPRSGSREIRIEDIGPNPYQPRTRFDETTLRELADSIRATGVLQPVILRKTDTDGYELVAGERRLRAAQLAGNSTIPAIVREVGDREMLELALIENVQREDLNPMDEARGYQALSDKLGLTHDQIAERVGKHRTAVTNSLRLLGLPVEVQDMVSRGTLASGHARALLALESPGEQLATARYVHSKAFSVRRTEALVNRKLRRKHSRPRPSRSADLTELESRLQQKFATRVTIRSGRKGGRVEFEYYSREDLERLLEAWAIV
jgi:ParB family chromosome partitioning protein